MHDSELAGVCKTVERYFPNIQSENHKNRIVDIRVGIMRIISHNKPTINSLANEPTNLFRKSKQKLSAQQTSIDKIPCLAGVLKLVRNLRKLITFVSAKAL